MGLSQFRRRTTDDLDLVAEGRLAGQRDRSRGDGIEGDVPETGARHGDLRREPVERPAMISMSAAVLETAEVGVVHQADIAALGTLDHNDIVFVEVFALVYEFHVTAPQGMFRQSSTITEGWRRNVGLVTLPMINLTIQGANWPNSCLRFFTYGVGIR